MIRIMTEKAVPPNDPRPTDGASQWPEAMFPETSDETQPEAQSPPNDWETVHFPGAQPVNGPASPAADPQAAGTFPSELELLQLVQDLNQCNEALLSRVATLEDALERSEMALQCEVERSQQSQNSSHAEAHAIISQQQQQIAQLLSEMDVSNDAVKRTTIHNETLQTELDSAQQRVAQLERECTLLQQRFSEKANALQQAEATCRDLRSRLQRQQRYTLQFKAALEKCLDMSAHQAQPPLTAPHAPVSPDPHGLQPLAMPKSQRIQPWSAEVGNARPDASLEHLLRGLKAAGQGPSAPQQTVDDLEPAFDLSPFPEAAALPTGPDPDAEKQLWQDLERVIDGSKTKETPSAGGSVQTPPQRTAPAPTPAVPQFTEPSPWGAPLTPAAHQTNPVEDSPEELESNPAEAAPATEQRLSPYPDRYATGSQSPSSAASSRAELPPLLNPTSAKSPSPVVYPLRPQKKIKSIAAVQLPSFPRSRSHS